jgi:hypothetical protein
MPSPQVGELELTGVERYEQAAAPWELLVAPVGSRPFQYRQRYVATPSFVLYEEGWWPWRGRRGLPRETVRRKIVMLIERGYIYRSEQGFLFVTTTVANDFEDMTAQLVENLLATARRLQLLLASQPISLGPLRLDPSRTPLDGRL